MAFHLYEDTWETSTTTGTASYALGGAVTGSRPFSAQYANNDTMMYSAYDGNNFEHGIGTYNSGANTLARTTIYRSSNGGSAVNWPSGIRQIVVSPLGVGLEQLLTPGTTGYQRQTGANTWVNDANGQIKNTTTTNDSANAGCLGEFVSSSVASGSAVSVSNNTAKDITSISLTAGDWDVWGTVFFLLGSGTTLTIGLAWLSTTSATNPTPPNSGMLSEWGGATLTGSATFTLPAGKGRISLSGSSTLYMSCYATFATSTLTAYGFVGARRVR